LVAIQVPSVGTPATAGWAGDVANQLNAARLIGTVSTANTATSTGATEVLHTGLLLAVTGLLSGTMYWVEWAGRANSSVAGDTVTHSIHALQGTVVIGSPVVASGQSQAIAGGYDGTWRFPWTPGASGSWNLQLGIKRVQGTGNGTFSGTFSGPFAHLSLTAT
jgi:hypothetical protein